MRHFRFTLEAVRSLREQTQNQAEQELARQLALREQHAHALDKAARRVEQARTAGAPAPGSAMPAEELMRRQSYVERVEREQDVAAAGLAAQERQVVHGRHRLELAAREREVLERLKKTHRAAHDREAARQEEAVLGEVALAAFQRRITEQAA